MKWPFVRRSNHEQLWIDFKIVQDERNGYLKHNNQLSDENDSLCQEIKKKDDIIANQMDNIKAQFDEINRLNQELASELNSHRETKEQKNELSAECDRLYDEVDNIKKELEKTKECFNYTIDGLRIHNNNIEKELQETKDALKIAQEDLENAALCISEQNTQLEIWKKRSNFYMGKCSIAKEEILKARGYLKTIAKKL